jgi:hypothetical protein
VVSCSDLDSDALALLADAPALAGLTDLELTDHRIAAEGVRALARSPYLCNLRTLGLGQDLYINSDSNLFDTEAVVALAGAANLGGLRSLHLGPAELTAEGCAALAESPHLSRVQSLTLAAGVTPSWRTDMAVRPPATLQPLLGSPLLCGLEKLDLGHCNLTPEAAAALFESPRPPRLRSLAFRVDHCGSAGVRSLLSAPWAAGLTELKLAGDPGSVSIDDLSTIPSLLAASESLGELRELNLRGLHVDDGGLKALVDSSHLGRLVSLKLCCTNRLSRAGFRALEEAAGLPALRRIDFSNTSLKPAVAEALAAGPLAARLVSLDLTGHDLGPSVPKPLLDRQRWPRLVRLGLARIAFDAASCQELRETWGPAVRLDESEE